ncbi:MAG: aldehyde dehydrogenase [candidate division KSB1 bacterium]|nr:aldehyde dehydrogenase [candidate division KSB1 bacterium]
MSVSDEKIRSIVKKVLEDSLRQPSAADTAADTASGSDPGWGVFQNMDDAIEAARVAFERFQSFDLQDRRKFTDAVRRVALDHKEEYSRMAVELTKMGRAPHKILKHINVAKNSPGIEYLRPDAWAGKNGLAVDEWSPWGVIGNISPSTHPSPTMLDNIIIQLSAGNTIAFNPHPVAKQLNARVIQHCNQAMTRAGAPENLVTCVAHPTLESAEFMFAHPQTKLLSITGGPAVVKAAMKHSKPIIAAGPGNPPVLVDESADLELAAREISESAAFDNNILCTAEKEVFIVDSVFDRFVQAFSTLGNIKLTGSQMDQLADKALVKGEQEYYISRDFVGRNASVLGRALGMQVSDEVGLLFGETDADHPWVQAEQMTPCLPLVRVRDFEQGLEACIQAEHGFEHTASIFTRDMNRATRYSKRIKTDIVVINGRTSRGDGGDLGEGYFSHTIASPTGHGIVTPRDFCRKRRIMTVGAMRFI